MTADQAKAALVEAGWAPGVSTAGHPHRAQIKAALRALRQAGVHVRSLGLEPRRAAPAEVPVDALPDPEPAAPAVPAGHPPKRSRTRS